MYEKKIIAHNLKASREQIIDDLQDRGTVLLSWLKKDKRTVPLS
jgi:hypothetical protein